MNSSTERAVATLYDAQQTRSRVSGPQRMPLCGVSGAAVMSAAQRSEGLTAAVVEGRTGAAPCSSARSAVNDQIKMLRGRYEDVEHDSHEDESLEVAMGDYRVHLRNRRRTRTDRSSIFALHCD